MSSAEKELFKTKKPHMLGFNNITVSHYAMNKKGTFETLNYM